MRNHLDLGAPIYSQYEQTVKLAREAERKESFHESAALYRKAAELMRQYAECSGFPEICNQRKETAIKLDAKALDILGGNISSKKPVETHANSQTTASPEDDYESAIKDLIQKTNVSWDDIGGLDTTKEAIQSAYVMALAQKPEGHHFEPFRNILMFGPPGTGKTTLAAATAGNLNSTFFSTKGSSLLSKYYGESSKLVAALYKVARRMAPSVVFIDEFEALTPQRGSGERSSDNKVVTEFLNTLDGFEKYTDNSFVLTIAATNYPWLLDDAIVSRFKGMPIYIPLPDEEARKAIFNIHLLRKGQKSAVDIDELVSRSQGYSGREIEMLCQQAVLRMLRRANPGMSDMASKGLEAIRKYQLKVEELSRDDFDSSFRQVTPVATHAMLMKYQTWMQNIDMKGLDTGG